MGEYTRDERLSKTIDRLTEENSRYFLGVLQALMFAQYGKDMVRSELTHREPEGGRTAVISGICP